MIFTSTNIDNLLPKHNLSIMKSKSLPILMFRSTIFDTFTTLLNLIRSYKIISQEPAEPNMILARPYMIGWNPIIIL